MPLTRRVSFDVVLLKWGPVILIEISMTLQLYRRAPPLNPRRAAVWAMAGDDMCMLKEIGLYHTRIDFIPFQFTRPSVSRPLSNIALRVKVGPAPLRGWVVGRATRARVPRKGVALHVTIAHRDRIPFNRLARGRRDAHAHARVERCRPLRSWVCLYVSAGRIAAVARMLHAACT